MGKRQRFSLGLILGLLTISLLFLGGCYGVPEGETVPDFSNSIWLMIIFLVVILGLMYLALIRPQRKRQQDHQQLIEELRRGDRVITDGGIYGQIESVSDESVVIKVESGTTIRVAKGSVAGKQIQEITGTR